MSTLTSAPTPLGSSPRPRYPDPRCRVGPHAAAICLGARTYATQATPTPHRTATLPSSCFYLHQLAWLASLGCSRFLLMFPATRNDAPYPVIQSSRQQKYAKDPRQHLRATRCWRVGRTTNHRLQSSAGTGGSPARILQHPRGCLNHRYSYRAAVARPPDHLTAGGPPRSRGVLPLRWASRGCCTPHLLWVAKHPTVPPLPWRLY